MYIPSRADFIELVAAVRIQYGTYILSTATRMLVVMVKAIDRPLRTWKLYPEIPCSQYTEMQMMP